jgi:hypothetical protein
MLSLSATPMRPSVPSSELKLTGNPANHVASPQVSADRETRVE